MDEPASSKRSASPQLEEILRKALKTLIPPRVPNTFCRLYTYEWTVINYSLIQNATTSPVFIVGQDDNEVMKFHLTPGVDGNGIIKISLNNLDAEEKKSDWQCVLDDAHLDIEFIDSNGEVTHFRTEIPFEIICIKKKKNFVWNMEENMSGFIEDDVLKLRAKLSLRYTIYCDKYSPMICIKDKKVKRLAEDINELFESNLLLDVDIEVGGHCFSGHKAVLHPLLLYIENLNPDSTTEVRSPESTDTASESLKEGRKTISIPNEDAEVFKAIMHYLYKGQIYSSDALNYFRLYEASQKYNFHELTRQLRPDEMYSRSAALRSTFGWHWYVRNYSVCCQEKSEVSHSPSYTIHIRNENIAWQVSMVFPDPQSIRLSLVKMNGVCNVQTTFKLIVCNPDGTPHEKREFRYLFGAGLGSFHPDVLNPETSFSITPDLLWSNTLALSCEITVADNPLTTESYRVHSGKPSHFTFKGRLANLEHLLETENFSDVKLLVDDVEMKCHKAILSARSPVFAKLFQAGTDESSSDSVRIEGIKASTMKFLLMHIYTGKIGGLTMKEAPALYCAAEKYCTYDLKEECETFIKDNMNIEVACHILAITDLHPYTSLKEEES